MKHVLLCFLFASILFSFSCKKGKTSLPPLIGEWTLKARYNDIGNGQIVWQAPAAGETHIIFESNGNYHTDVRDLGLSGKFGIASDTTLLLSVNNIASIIAYKLTDDTLILKLPCTEPCGLKFEK